MADLVQRSVADARRTGRPFVRPFWSNGSQFLLGPDIRGCVAILGSTDGECKSLGWDLGNNGPQSCRAAFTTLGLPIINSPSEYVAHGVAYCWMSMALFFFKAKTFSLISRLVVGGHHNVCSGGGVGTV